MPAVQLDHYASRRHRTLAHAHARSGDPLAIDAYLGENDDFDQAIAEFYDITQIRTTRTQAFIAAAHSGRITVE